MLQSGLPVSQCPHLHFVDFYFTHASWEDLKPAVLEELVSANLIRKDMRVNRYDQATQNSALLLTLLDLGGHHCLYLSVFEPKVAQYSKSGMVFVTYNVRGKLCHCGCFRGRKCCLHKCIAKSFLFQTNKELFFPDAKPETPLSIPELTVCLHLPALPHLLYFVVDVAVPLRHLFMSSRTVHVFSKSVQIVNCLLLPGVE